MSDEPEPERTHPVAGVVLVVAAVAYVALLQWLAACSRPVTRMPAARAAEVRSNSTHCLAGVAVLGGHETDLEVCASIAEVCEWFYAQAVDLGYPVLSVSECEEVDRGR